MADTVFNDPEKAKRTRENLAEYFKTDDRPALDIIKGWLGLSSPMERGVLTDQDLQRVQPASYSPWQRMRDNNE